MKIVFLRSSEPDLSWFGHYYRSVFPEGRRNAQREMSATLQKLSVHPEIGPKEADAQSRRLVILRTPFALIYRVTQDRIEILRVRDDRANPAFSSTENDE